MAGAPVVLLVAALSSSGGAGSAAVDTVKPAREPTQLGQRLITADDGLTNDNIQAILQARDGRLWIGTLGGLHVFDGTNLLSVRDLPGAERALPDTRINALAEDREGGLWVGTHDGLALLKDGRWQRYGTKAGLLEPETLSIAFSPSGRMWVASGNKGLVTRAPGAARFALVPGTESQRIQAMVTVPGSENLWAGLGTGTLLEIAPSGLVRRFGRESGLSAAAITALAVLPGGDLMIGTQGGLYRMAPGRRARRVALAPAPQNDWVRALAVDRGGAVWVGLNDGMGRLTPTGLAPIDRGGVPFAEPVKLITIDRDGAIWAGTTSGILALTQGPGFTIDAAEGLPLNAGGLVCSDPDGAVWSASDSRGLSVRRPGQRDRFERVGGLPGTQLFGLACAPGGPWVAINGVGVGQSLPGGGFALASGWPRAREATVITMLRDRAGRVWVGTFGDGLVRRETDGRWTLLGRAQGLPASAITALFEARDGTIWIGTQAGVVIWREGRAPQRLDANAIPGGLVMSFAQDRDGDIWIGSRGGVSLSSAGRLVSLSGGRAPFAAGFAATTDRSGAVWVASELGIVRFSKTDFLRAAANPASHLPFRKVGAADGVEGTPVWASPGSAMDPQGRVWFATTRGLAVVDPEALKASRPAPPARIVGVTVGGTARDAGAAVQLSPERPRLDIRFAATALTDASLLTYRYRLVGFDRDWVTSTRGEAIYTNLPAGTYRFDVATRLGDGPETVSTGLIEIVQTPPFYARGWFIGLAALGVLGLVVAPYRLRMGAIRERHAAILDERTRIARDMHDTLLQSLAGLAIQVQAAARSAGRSPEETRAELAEIASEARRSLVAARDAVWDIRTGPGGDSDDFATMLGRVTQQQTDGTGIERSLALTGSWHGAPPAVLEALCRIVQEAVRNAVLHGRARRIAISGHSDAGSLNLTIEDDGSGFVVDPSRSALGGHWGLLGMRERAERLGGRLRLDSAPGQGTTITVEIPA